MKSKLTPLFDKIIVRRDESQKMTKGGLHLPDQAQDKPKRGKVLAVGQGRVNETTGDRLPMDVTEGQTVLFSSYAGSEVDIDGEQLLIMRQEDVLAVVG